MDEADEIVFIFDLFGIYAFLILIVHSGGRQERQGT